jgi:hypothetical protein
MREQRLDVVVEAEEVPVALDDCAAALVEEVVWIAQMSSAVSQRGGVEHTDGEQAAELVIGVRAVNEVEDLAVNGVVPELGRRVGRHLEHRRRYLAHMHQHTYPLAITTPGAYIAVEVLGALEADGRGL